MKTTRGIVLSALFAALLAVFSFVRIPIPWSPVPVVLENIVPMLAGALLGPLYGFFSMFLVILLTAIGVPMLGGSGGISLLLGYTGGYIVAWPFNALLIGLFLSKLKAKNSALNFILSFVVITVFGALFTYVIGVPWLAAVAKMSMSKAMVSGCYPFLPGDIAKAFVSAVIATAVRRAYPAGIVGSSANAVVKLDA
jgi:biotin transport system substrate-specific component